MSRRERRTCPYSTTGFPHHEHRSKRGRGRSGNKALRVMAIERKLKIQKLRINDLQNEITSTNNKIPL